MALNFKPEMDPKVLIEGYRRVTATLYDPTLENYFKRCLTLFEHLKPVPHLLKPRSKNAIYGELMGVRGRLSANQVPAYMNFIAKSGQESSQNALESDPPGWFGLPLSKNHLSAGCYLWL